MHLAVDDTGQEMEPAGVHDLLRSPRIEGAQSGNPPVFDRQIQFHDAAGRDRGPPLNDQIEVFAHGPNAS
jgi:hypothetical protein